MAGIRLAPEESPDWTQQYPPPQQQLQTGREVASDDERSVASDSWSIKSDYGSTLDDEQRHADAAEALSSAANFRAASDYSSDKDEPDADAMTSMLGLQSYWDAAYADELVNFHVATLVKFGLELMSWILLLLGPKPYVLIFLKVTCQIILMRQSLSLLNRMINICLAGVYLTLALAMVCSFRNLLSRGTL